MWNDIVWADTTEGEYMNQILDWREGQEPDDACFIAGTKIMTLWGEKNIEDVKIGDKVITPFGFKKVEVSGCTGIREVIQNVGLCGTPNHKVYNSMCNCFTTLDSLTSVKQLDTLSLGGLLRWKIKQLLFLMDRHTQKLERQDIITVNESTLKGRELFSYIKQFGNFITKQKFLKGIISTIKILIKIIMILLIWSLWKLQSIYRYMVKGILKIVTMWNKIKNHWIKSEIVQKFGMGVKKVKNGIVNIHKNLWQKYGLLENREFASNVIKITRHDILHKCIAHNCVGIDTEMDMENQNKKCVSYVEKSTLLQEEKEVNCIVPLNVKKLVYNLKVKDVGVYYANGVLVSNCDSAASLVRQNYTKRGAFRSERWKW